MQCSKLSLITVFGLLAFASDPALAVLSIVNVDVQDGGSPRDKTGLAAITNDPAGATPSWNLSGLTGAALEDSFGDATAIGYAITSTNGGQPGTFRQQNSSGQDNLLYDYAFDNSAPSSGRNLTLSITGLDPALNHELYLYGGIQFSDNADGIIDYTVNGTTQRINWLGLDGGSSTTSYNEGENYVVFGGLTGSSITLNALPQQGEPTIMGFQIVSLPEPSRVLLLGLGALSLIVRRRR